MKRDGRWCPLCKRDVLAVGESPNHVLHLLLTLVTCGLWGIVWGLVAAGAIGGYRCGKCGGKV